MSDDDANQWARVDWSRLHHGTCPKCGEFKFIGHGPLCVECFTAPPESTT